MDPITADVNLALLLINTGMDFFKRIKAEHGMTDEQLSAYIDKQSAQNADDIKGLLAL